MIHSVRFPSHNLKGTHVILLPRRYAFKRRGDRSFCIEHAIALLHSMELNTLCVLTAFGGPNLIARSSLRSAYVGSTEWRALTQLHKVPDQVPQEWL